MGLEETKWLRPNPGAMTRGRRVSARDGELYRGLGVLVMGLGFIGMILANRLELGVLLGGAAYGCSFLLIGAGVKLRARGLRIQQPDGIDRMAMDTRPPIVMLRPFAIDDTKIDAPRGIAKHFLFTSAWFRSEAGWTMEQAVVDAFSKKGPVVTIGRPREDVAPFGAGRVYVSESDDWHAVVGQLLNQAQRIVVIMGDGRGLQWEIAQVLRSAELRAKTILLAPENNKARASCWQSLQTELSSVIDIPMNTIALEIGKDGRARSAATLSSQCGWIECVRGLAR